MPGGLPREPRGARGRSHRVSGGHRLTASPPARPASPAEPVDPARLFRRLPLCRSFLESAVAAALRDLPFADPALDLAAGDGQLSLSLSRGRFLFEHGRESDPALARAAFRTGLYGRVSAGPPDRLPCPAGRFRTAFALSTRWPHPAPLDAACREAARVTAPGALLVVALPMAGAVGLRARLFAAARAAAGLPAPPPEAAVSTALEAAGFRVTRSAGFRGALSGALCALFALNLAKARVYQRLLDRPLPFPDLHARCGAPLGILLDRLARLLETGDGEHRLLVARREP